MFKFNRYAGYDVMTLKKDSSIEDFDAAFQTYENAESYDLYITLPDCSEDEYYAEKVRKIAGDENKVLILEKSDLL